MLAVDQPAELGRTESVGRGGIALTLILAYLDRGHVLQVGDRLVSAKWPGRKTYEPHEPLANKAVVYVARDAVVVASYTGAAYIKGINTDTWIANALAPITAANREYGITLNTSEPVVPLGVAVNRMRDKLQQDFIAMPSHKRSIGLSIQIVGWQWSERQRAIDWPILWRVWIGAEAGATASIDRLSRDWGENRSRIEAIGNVVTRPDRKLNNWINNRGQSCTPFGINDVEQAMVEIIREISDQSGGTVGRNCISVLFDQSRGDARIRYFPDVTSPGYPVFTPWIVAPGVGAMKPMIMIGDLLSPSFRGLDIVFERVGPPMEPPDISGARSWPRKPEPR